MELAVIEKKISQQALKRHEALPKRNVIHTDYRNSLRCRHSIILT